MKPEPDLDYYFAKNLWKSMAVKFGLKVKQEKGVSLNSLCQYHLNRQMQKIFDVIMHGE